MLRFRLRTMLIGVAVLAVPMAWVGWQLNWIRQRRSNTDNIVVLTRSEGWSAPGCLWLFGESAAEIVAIYDPTSKEEAKRLFPEAAILDFSKHRRSR